MTEALSLDQQAVYDRQIRLWGAEAQRRLIASRILLVGVDGLGVEVAKNLLLSGVGRLEILDDAVVSEHDLQSQYYLTCADVGTKTRAEASAPRLAELNPFGSVVVFQPSSRPDQAPLPDDTIFSVDAETLAQFSLVCTCNVISLAVEKKLNDLCRAAGCAFMSVHSWGLMGAIFQDFGSSFEFVVSRKQEDRTISETRCASFVTMSQALRGSWASISRPSKILLVFFSLLDFQASHSRLPFDPSEFCRHILSFCRSRCVSSSFMDAAVQDTPLVAGILNACQSRVLLTPVCAILGGFGAQEVMKYLSRQDEPICNVLLYDGFGTFACLIETLRPTP